MRKVKVFAPATVANVGCGFDVMGLALEGIGDEITITQRADSKIVISKITGADLPYDPNNNVVGAALKALLAEHDQAIGVDIEIDKKVMPGSGLGSSASSSAGIVVAANILLGNPFSKNDLVRFAMEGERLASKKPHADNVAASIYGGFVLIRSISPLDIIPINYPDNLVITIAHPQIEVKTAEAKKMLKESVRLDDAITQWGNTAGLVAGLMKGDYDLIGRSIMDVVAEPIRSLLIPFYHEAKQKAREAGAIGFNISGSGPAMFAITNDLGKAEKIKSVLHHIYESNGIPINCYISGISSGGVSEKI
ncbi:MAG: homoserine kinase [Cyclobacteriaceae bacterium]|nr:homoserine kinase [Cyclobacteriaceae bacterium]